MDVKEGDLKEVRFDGTEVGEIVMRGNLVLKVRRAHGVVLSWRARGADCFSTSQGYYKNEEATNKAFAGGYFHTGDLAVRREDGTFAIQGASRLAFVRYLSLTNCLHRSIKGYHHQRRRECIVIDHRIGFDGSSRRS